MSEQIAFQVYGDWLTDYIREPYWKGSISYDEAIERACQILYTTEEGYKELRDNIAPGILTGRLRLEGVNDFTIVNDDQEEAYRKTRAYKEYERQKEREAATVERERREAPLIQQYGDRLKKNQDTRKVVEIALWDSDASAMRWDADKVIWAVPDEDMTSEYGLISPRGEWYSCEFAAHNSLATHLVERDETLRLGCEQKYPGRHGAVDDNALQYLCDLGWLCVRNPWISGRACPDWISSKYNGEDDLPQCMLNTLYDWEIKQREEN